MQLGYAQSSWKETPCEGFVSLSMKPVGYNSWCSTDPDKVDAWTVNARLTLNASMCETAFFSLDCAELSWQPNVTIDWESNVLQWPPDYLGWQVRPAAHHYRACPKPLPIDVPQHQPSPGSGDGTHRIIVHVHRSIV